MSKTQEVEPS